MGELRIDAKIKGLIPARSTLEQTLLEESILAEGCREPLVVWKEKGVLLDGHNRYAICTTHGLPFKVTELSFKTKREAMAWVIHTSLERRNLSSFDRVRLWSKYAELVRAKARERQREHGGTAPGRPKTLLPNSAEVIDVREAIAAKAGVSHDTVWKVQQIEKYADEATKERLSCGEISIRAAYLRSRPEAIAQRGQKFGRKVPREEQRAKTKLQEIKALYRRLGLVEKSKFHAWLDARRQKER